jgi:hypothetical protein
VYAIEAEIERSGNPRDVLNRKSVIYTVSQTRLCKSFHGLTAFLGVLDLPRAAPPMGMTAAFTTVSGDAPARCARPETDPKGGSMYRTVVAATLTLLFVVVGFALVVPMASAQTECGTEGQPECPCGTPGQPACPTCGEEGQPPCPTGLCHNIGGPRELGANCDGTGFCSYQIGGVTVGVPAGQFLGIIIGTNSANAIAAHIAHGDGPILFTFTPPLHLASEGQNHRAANVDCLGQRIVPQPPEPGN